MIEYFKILKSNFYNLYKFRFIFYIILWKNVYLVISLKELKLYRVNHPKRLLRFKKSIRERVSRVGNAYNLEIIKDELLNLNHNSINIIDCGANIGEIGTFFKQNKLLFNYFCFEPLKIAIQCLKFNHPEAKIFKFGLSNVDDTKIFFIKNDTNDSSLIEFSDYDTKIELQVRRLDGIREINSLHMIHLLKIDGEGYEPEIVEGLKNILDKILYISVDCGPERNNESSDFLVENLLSKKFDILMKNKLRNTILFKNKKIF